MKKNTAVVALDHSPSAAGTLTAQRPLSCPRLHPYPSTQQIAATRAYIKRTWETLRRGHDHIVTAAKDTKVEHWADTAWPVYISQREDKDAVAATLQAVMADDYGCIRIETLPDDPDTIEAHGLLYLPGDYVVPGGRFNELYGWDSYFILLGLLHDDEIALAQSLTDQLLYQIEHYGAVLNANRTYFLGRSQPPLLAAMVVKLYERTRDLAWLKRSLPLLEDYYQYWISEPHYDAATTLSRFYATGAGPAPEVVVSERDEAGRTHFDRIKDFYRSHEITDYDVSLFYDAEKDELTDLFFKGDRSMRESGFDPTDRFGPFSVDIVHYLPVCLNALLYQMEQDIAKCYQYLEEASDDATESHNCVRSVQLWQARASQRQKQLNHYLWDEDSGLYLDYHWERGQRRYYEFATTFYPLWVGVASEQQAQAVVDNLDKFEAAGGVRTSTQTSGNQWDDPFGWAPLQLIAVEGLVRYGYIEDAKRLARRFIALTVTDFDRSGSLLEKYELDSFSGEVSDEIQYGYSSNEIGFGWTNGVVLALLDLLERL